MSTCRRFVTGSRVCGEPIKGTGPCATCGLDDGHNPNTPWHHYLMPEPLPQYHPYAPSSYVCAAGHVQSEVPA